MSGSMKMDLQPLFILAAADCPSQGYKNVIRLNRSCSYVNDICPYMLPIGHPLPTVEGSTRRISINLAFTHPYESLA
jgi:hypothetical protein